MARVAVLCLVAALVAAATSAAAAAGLSCGSTLTDVPMSGCTACTELNITGMGRGRRDGPPGGLGRKLLHQGGPDGLFGGSMLVPSCTECDTGSNFVLLTRNGTGTGRCGCAAGFGTVFTTNATVIVGNFTKVIPQFECVQCAAGEVPLGPNSNVRPSYSNGTWTLLLVNSTSAAGDATTTANLPRLTGLTGIRNGTRRHRNRTHRGKASTTAAVSSVSLPTADIPSSAGPVVAAAAAAPIDALTAAPVVGGVAVASRRGGADEGGRPGGPGGMFSLNTPPPRPEGGDHAMFGGPDGPGFGRGERGFDGHDFDGAGRAPYAPGQCVACPEGSTTSDGIACVAL